MTEYPESDVRQLIAQASEWLLNLEEKYATMPHLNMRMKRWERDSCSNDKRSRLCPPPLLPPKKAANKGRKRTGNTTKGCITNMMRVSKVMSLRVVIGRCRIENKQKFQTIAFVCKIVSSEPLFILLLPHSSRKVDGCHGRICLFYLWNAVKLFNRCVSESEWPFRGSSRLA
ncbi:hypothetical protein VFPPC_18697 [Pochonia chlamydosporia 170]|uniref:Uncharacterized protein n=1 Tax=Pochonia chlamydosporia 170 TaxID=1380566 RepID=A0A219AS25_METCM|nr:hypothetical protein VFPPC_18697 [Pochonia chlamydosporia 170]OWT43576.1 hypothetical protein VFPPC_18697 [Pochonia chlamydosporia 170]